MKPELKARLIRTLILCLLAFGVGAGISYMQVRSQNATILKQSESPSDAGVAGLKIGGPFILENQDGESVTQEILEGHYNLIYFGFTYCPAICPTELQKITRVMKGLEEKAPDIAAKIQPVFITIDPERDTAVLLKDYMSLFHPKLIGLTGTVPQIDHAKKIYRIFARKVYEEGAPEDEYTMDHSSYIYLLDPQGTLLAMYRTQDAADFMYEDVKSKIDL